MVKIKFKKPSLNSNNKISLLKGRGLIIKNKKKAKHYLKNIWYYRLSWYLKFFQWKDENMWKNDFIIWTTFEQVINLYVFDRKLRLLSLDAIEKIEVSLKSNINDYMSWKFWVYWFLNIDNFYLKDTTNLEIYWRLLWKLKLKKRNTTKDFVRKFFNKHKDEYLPSWMLFEELTLWELSSIYKILLKNDQQIIAKNYHVDFEDLATRCVWINSIRNISAHHSRLWNKYYKAKLKIDDDLFWTTFEKGTNNSWAEEVIPNYFNSALIINHLLKNINKNFWWLDDLDNLFNEHPWIKELMWFSDDWKEKFKA